MNPENRLKSYDSKHCKTKVQCYLHRILNTSHVNFTRYCEVPMVVRKYCNVDIESLFTLGGVGKGEVLTLRDAIVAILEERTTKALRGRPPQKLDSRHVLRLDEILTVGPRAIYGALALLGELPSLRPQILTKLTLSNLPFLCVFIPLVFSQKL